MIKLILISFLFSITSCSLFIDNFNGDILEENNVVPLPVTKQTTCKKPSSQILLSPERNSQETFHTFYEKLNKTKRFRFIDKAVLWSLIQMNLRPDLSSPTAKLQILLKIKKEKYYHSFSKEKNLFPYLKLLDQLLKEHKSRYSLFDLAKMIDQNYHYPFLVSKELEIFLLKNKKKIAQNLQLKNTFFRGDETLQENESLPKINFRKIVSLYLKTKKASQYSRNSFLFEYKTQGSLTPYCNFDMNLYKESNFLIHKNEIESHIFGLKDKKNVFMAMSSQEIDLGQTIKNSFLFSGKSHVRSSAICLFKNKFHTSSPLWLFSTQSRDPGQHIFHLNQYGLNQTKSVKELDSLLKFSRHQFLQNPVRLVIESRRSSKEQLEELLKLNIPIYNAKRLGKIWAYYDDSKNPSFLLDERRQGALTCISK
ncbi:MAG: hypothetical protein QF441_01430 [Bacteriovoracaceae bacterium]|jgi:hypothetical protein|nr:hypothetical protein [Halobacteriovoraceae bacterium]MDP7319233.1 hypothetical protein [Bacteriovoracaceae bacterium]